jgi:glycerol-3-phosphate acyltransferase PlsY
MLINIGLFVGCYLIAAMPFGYWLGLAYGKDLTKIGSGSTGATNVLRNLGKWQAILVLLLDFSKGFVPVYLLKHVYTDYITYGTWLFLLFSITPIIAHSKSIYIGFKGGKSSATGLGVLFALNAWAGLIALVIWILAVYISKISSMGSIVTVPLVAVWLWLFKEPVPIIFFGVIAFIYIVLFKHSSNIKRLLEGKEPKFGQK